MVNEDAFSNITFLSEDTPIYVHNAQLHEQLNKANQPINELFTIIKHGFSVSAHIDHNLFSCFEMFKACLWVLCASILLLTYHLPLLLTNNHTVPLDKAEELSVDG
jgi:hypothetical protein